MVNDHRVCVEVEVLLQQSLQGFLQIELRPTGDETGHENVQVLRHVFQIFVQLEMDFHPICCQRPDVSNIVLSTAQEGVHVFSTGKLANLSLVGLLVNLNICLATMRLQGLCHIWSTTK